MSTALAQRVHLPVHHGLTVLEALARLGLAAV